MCVMVDLKYIQVDYWLMIIALLLKRVDICLVEVHSINRIQTFCIESEDSLASNDCRVYAAISLSCVFFSTFIAFVMLQIV